MILKELLEEIISPYQTIHLFARPYDREPVKCDAQDLMEMFKPDILEMDIEKIQAIRAPIEIILKRKPGDNKIPLCEKCEHYNYGECKSLPCLECKNGSNFEEVEDE